MPAGTEAEALSTARPGASETTLKAAFTTEGGGMGGGVVGLVSVGVVSGGLVSGAGTLTTALKAEVVENLVALHS